MIQTLRRLAPALLTLLAAVGVIGASPALAASSCPTQTFLTYNHLDFEAATVPATVQVPAGSAIGRGTVDEPTNGNGCRRAQSSVGVQSVGSLDTQVVVRASARPHLLFVIGHRCDGFSGSAYWDCLLHPLSFNGQQFTATRYPATPAPRKTLSLGGQLGNAVYQGQKVTVRSIQGVVPSLAVGISGQPSTALLSPRTCPYSGFSNNPQLDNLLRCLHGPVFFSFDPPGSPVGGTVTGRADRTLSPAVAGATISLVSLPLVADLVPSSHGKLVPVGRVADQVNLKMPDVPGGLYEAVVSCPRCGSSGGVDGLYPAGSILITAKAKKSVPARVISIALAIAFVIAAFLAIRTWRRRRRAMGGAGGSGGGRFSRR